ncbi:hypothetical protein EVAR_8202_1 [Eumeta japonica]|uniref:Uncharacterized protein n=1 Tax=Eumeta variegata TaxID=151549 RepID=A0A4C1TIQ6_EUMVA|nr:hypothetical protein EVAR_8202_1 [Eumeta japonica]
MIAMAPEVVARGPPVAFDTLLSFPTPISKPRQGLTGAKAPPNSIDARWRAEFKRGRTFPKDNPRSVHLSSKMIVTKKMICAGVPKDTSLVGSYGSVDANELDAPAAPTS